MSATSAWVEAVDRALARQRPVIVARALRDRAMWAGQVVEPLDALARCARRLGYEHVVAWSAASGYANGPSQPAQVPRVAYEDQPDDGPQAEDPFGAAALEAHALVRDGAAPVLVVVEAVDHLLPTASPVALDALRQAIAHRSAVRTPAGAPSTIVLLCDELDGVPPELRSDGRVQRVVASPPGIEVRRALLRAAVPSEDRDAAEAILVPALDGHSLSEIESLKRLSRVHDVPFSDPRRLLRVFRGGAASDPWARLTPELIAGTDAWLAERLQGQPDVRAEVVRRIGRAAVEVPSTPLEFGQRSRLVFLITGPPGVGKTLLAQLLAERIFGDPRALVRLNMSGYTEAHHADRLTGAPPGYVGFENGGELTERLHNRPHCVILLDEMEKAHVGVWLRLLSLLDNGSITDGRGHTANVSDAIVLLTTNIGAGEIAAVASAGRPVADVIAEGRRQVEHFLKLPPAAGRPGLGRAELWSRLKDDILVLTALGSDSVEGMVSRWVETTEANHRILKGRELMIDREGLTELVSRRLRAPGTWDGRDVDRRCGDAVWDAVSDHILSTSVPPDARLDVRFAGGRASVTHG